MSRIRLLLPAIVAALLLIGCSKPEDQFVGKYTGSVEIPEEVVNLAKQFSPDQAATIDDAINNPNLFLELKKDGIYTITSNGTSTDGTWSLSEDQKSVTLVLSEEAQQNAKDQVETMKAEGDVDDSASSMLNSQLDSLVSDKMNYTISEDKTKLTLARQIAMFEIKIHFTRS